MMRKISSQIPHNTNLPTITTFPDCFSSEKTNGGSENIPDSEHKGL